MNFEKKLKNYSRMLIQTGCNLQKGQELLLNAPVDCAPFVRLLVEEAYLAGAKEVVVTWSDERVSRLKYDNCGLELFETVPEWLCLLQNGMADRGAAMLSITSSDPDAFKGIDHRKLSAWNRAVHRDCKPYYDGMDFGRNVWCIAGAPSAAWAKKVFPGCSEEEAIAQLWDAILKTARADGPDPVGAWAAHEQSFKRRVALLNDLQLYSLRYRNDRGTDLTIGLPRDHAWAGGGDTTVGGVCFFPNMPTEEIFCSPHKDQADGVVFSSMPLNYKGSLIDDFSLTFRKGRVVDYSAKVGYDALKSIVETDEGSHHLGEAALISKSSPIAQMDLLFYNTLYDENASCHLAIGLGFSECLQSGRKMTEQQLFAQGINESAVHVDFMLGTPDLQITGIDQNGREIQLFAEGDWAPKFYF